MNRSIFHGSRPSEWSVVVPELACTNFDASLEFYTLNLGFAVQYRREAFAYLSLGEAQLMLEQAPGDWPTGELNRPFGRGMNLQIQVDDVQALAARLQASAVPLFRNVADTWYRIGQTERGQQELLVQDPDGYLLRFMTPLGERQFDDGNGD